LAQAEIESEKNPKIAEQSLVALEREAREKGFARLASEARHKLQELAR
jgi:hypothetical protein